MRDKDKELKMKVLQDLMDEMDERAASRLKPKGDMAVIEEKQVVPADQVGDVLKKKMKNAIKEDDEMDSDSSSDMRMGPENDDEMEDDEGSASDSDEFEDYGSRIMKRIKEAKAARSKN